jgi:hypothetical protein
VNNSTSIGEGTDSDALTFAIPAPLPGEKARKIIGMIRTTTYLFTPGRLDWDSACLPRVYAGSPPSAIIALGASPVLLKASQRELLQRQTRLTTTAVSDSTGQFELP